MELMGIFAGIVSNAIAHVMAANAASEYKKDSVRILYLMFSEREREYLDFYSRGLSRREIAKAMDVFPETCDAYFRRIKGKLDTMSINFKGFIDDLDIYLKSKV